MVDDARPKTSESRESRESPSAAQEAVAVREIVLHQRRTWLARNVDAISAYNESVEKRGVLSSGLWTRDACDDELNQPS
jgi:hypothetical protein